MLESKTIMETTMLKLNFTKKYTINWKEQVSRICLCVLQGHLGACLHVCLQNAF